MARTALPAGPDGGEFVWRTIIPRVSHEGLAFDKHNAFYFVDEFYAPERERCVRWNDARFRVAWPVEPAVISDKDRNQKDFDPGWHLGP